MANTIGQLEIDLIANIARLQSDMNKATGTVNRAMGSIDKAVGATNKLLSALGVGVSFAVLIGQATKAIDVLARLDDMAQKTGSSVENLSKLQKVASQFGQDFNAVDMAISKLAKGLAGIDDESGRTTKALNAIGISQEFVKSSDPSEVMIKIAKNLQNYQDGASKAALATDLFGKTGVELLPFLNDAAEAVDKFTGASAESAAKAAKLKDDIGALKVKFDELVTTITTSMLPVLDSFIGKVNQILKFKSLFSTVGGIDAKDYDKELLKREKDLADLVKTRDALSKPTTANKINDFIFGDVKDLNLQITIFQDEIQALKDLKKARDAVKASPYKSPNDTKAVLEYQGAEAENKKSKELADTQKKAQEALTKQRLGAQELYWDTEATKYDQQIKRIVEEDKLKEKQYKDDLKRMDMLQDQANANFKEAQELYKKAEDEKQKEFEKTVDGINQTFREGFAQLINGGKGSWKSFTQSLFTTFKTTVADSIYKLFAQPFVVKLVASILGVGASGTASAGGALSALTGTGDNSILGSLSSIKDIFSTGNASIVSGIESLGTFLSTGNGGLGDVLGGFIGQYSTQIANVLPYAGSFLKLLQGDIKGAAFTAIGTALGSFFGPIGGAIGGFLGNMVGGLFGGKDYDRYGTVVRGTSSGGKYTETSRGVVYDKDIGGGNALSSLNKAFSDTLISVFSSFGISQDVNLNSMLYQRGKSEKSGGKFRAKINDIVIDVAFEGKKISLEKAFQGLTDKMFGEGLAKIIKASDLPDGIKKFFDTLTGKDEVLDAVSTLANLKKALIDLPAVFNAVKNAIDTTAYQTSIDALKAQFAATQNFVNLFYSDAEKFDIFSKQLVTQFGALNQALPTSRDQYRALVESINVVDDATRNQFNGLIALAPAMAEYFNLLEQQAEGINQVNEALAAGLDSNLFGSYANFASARANVALGNSPAPFVGTNTFTPSGDPALLLEIKTLRQEQADTRTVLEAIAAYTYDSAKTQKQWNNDGLPAERT
jgi:hypothetical protein